MCISKGITDRLNSLGQASQKLNRGSDYLNRLIERIDEVLGRLMIGIDHVHPRPLAEAVTVDRAGKRVIELSYLGYLRVQGSYHLAIKTVKVLESRAALATEDPGSVIPLLQAPRMLRHAAVDHLPDLVGELAEQVDDVVGAMERRCAAAHALLKHLEDVASPPAVGPAGSGNEWGGHPPAASAGEVASGLAVVGSGSDSSASASGRRRSTTEVFGGSD